MILRSSQSVSSRVSVSKFRLKNTGRKDDFKIVAKRKFDSEPYDSFVE